MRLSPEQCRPSEGPLGTTECAPGSSRPSRRGKFAAASRGGLILLRLHFSPEFSPTPWVSLFSPEVAAVAGVAAVGTDGLLAQLELRLGLPAPPTPSEREARFAGVLRRTDGPWSDSARTSPFATARTLLQRADALRLHGASFAALPPRWQHLLAPAFESPGGVVDRVARILPRLEARSLCGELFLHCEPHRVPATLRPLLAALTSSGWRLHPAVAPPPRPTATVRVLKAASPHALATALVDRLPPPGATPTTLVVGPDAVLDRALQRRGRPTLGATRDDHPARALLAHVFALAFAPQDPQDALDLLSLPFQPVPESLAALLRAALAQWPSTRSPAWMAAFAKAPTAPSSSHVPPTSALAALFVAEFEAGEAPSLHALRRRWLPLRQWLVAISRDGADSRSPIAEEVCTRGDGLFDVLESLGVTVTRQTLAHALAFVDETWSSPAVAPPHAGTFTVPDLAAVRAPARQLVCWNLGPSASRDPLSFLLPSERATLRAAGVELPRPADVVRAAVEDAWTACSFIEETIWLCLPDRDERGEATAPVSILPILEARWRQHTGAGFLDAEPATLTDPMELAPRAPPKARRRWAVPPMALRPRKVESPSSVTRALGCSLQHTLQYQARLRDPLAPALPTGGLLFGRLAHEILAATLRAPPDSAETRAGDRVRRCFDDTVAERAASLDLPGALARRHLLRERIAATAVGVEALLQTSRRTVLSQEVELSPPIPFGPVMLRGTPDLVLGPAPVVLDFKWSLGGHRTALAEGTAAQLALYAWMLRGRDGAAADDAWPAVGYVVVTTAALYVSPNAALPLAEPVAGPSMASVAAGVLAGLDAHVASLAGGELTAAGISGDEAPVRVDALEEGRLSVRAPCAGCAFDGLCGRALTPESAR